MPERAVFRVFYRLAAGVRRALGVTLLMVPIGPLNAQASFVSGTFGSGDSFNQDISLGLAIDPRQNVAQRFDYAGPTGYSLSRVRLALLRSPFDIQYNVSLWSGPDMNAATLLESWRVDAPAVAPFAFSEFSIFSMPSVAAPTLSNGFVYWISVASPTAFGGGWAVNSQDITGEVAYILNPRPGWRSVIDASMAFDVTAVASVVPEPSAMWLLSGGLLMLGFARHYRRTRLLRVHS